MRALIVVAALAGIAHAQPAPPSKTLERAIKLYDKADYFSSAIELKKVLDGESGDDAANKQRAEFFMGKTLTRMDFPVAAMGYFERILQNPSHTYYAASHKWLVPIFEVPGGTIQVSVLGGMDPSVLADPSFDGESRDALRFYAGLDAVRRGQGQRATAFFDAIPRDSKWSPRAFLARVQLPSTDIPMQLAEASRDPELGGDVVFYLADLPSDPRATKLLDGLAGTLPHAALEKSRRAVVARGRWTGMIGADVVHALAIGTACVKGETADGREAMELAARDLRTIVTKLERYDDNAEAYEYVAKVRKLSLDHPARAALHVILSDRATRERAAFVAELVRELQLLQDSDKAWQTTQIAAEILQELIVQMSVAQADLGKHYRGRLDGISEDIGQIAEALAKRAGNDEPLPLGPRAERGLVVSVELCRAALGSAGRLTQIAVATTPATQPVGGPPVQGKGCGGCATSSPVAAGVMLLVAVGLVRPRRARRAR